MSDTENVTGDVNQPVNDERVSQNELQGGISENPSQDSAVDNQKPQEPQGATDKAVESENAEVKVPEDNQEQQRSFHGLGLPELGKVLRSRPS